MTRIFKSLDDVQPVNSNGTNHLGSGSFAKVNLVCHRNDPNKWYAMKEVSKKNEQDRNFIFKEITLHMSLEHQNVIRCEDYLESHDKVYIFLEYAKEGDLFGYIKHKNPNEQQMLTFFYQTCLAIEYIHSKNIMHRDLKPENILVNADLNVKLCDFGWSAEYRESVNRETLCGTYEYMAPEIFFRNKQTKKTDIWALGILLYELYHGNAPFRGTRMDAVMQAIMQNTIAFKKNLAPEVKDLILKILMFDPKKRLTIEEILKHELLVNFIKSKKTRSPEKENYHLKPRYMNTDNKMTKKRPEIFSNSFYTPRANETEYKPQTQTVIMAHNTITNLKNQIAQKPFRPDDISLFLKKKPKAEDFDSLRQYTSVDKMPSDSKILPSRFNNPLNQTISHNSSFYTQRVVNGTHSFSNSNGNNVKFVPQRTMNNQDSYNYPSNQISYNKPDVTELKFASIYNPNAQSVKYNVVKQKLNKTVNSSFTNYFNIQNK